MPCEFAGAHHRDASSSGDDRSKDGRRRWSVAQPLGRKPAPVMRTKAVDSLDASPAVTADGFGPSARSGKSKEVPGLFEPSPTAVASAGEMGEAKTVVMPDQVVSTGGGDAASDGPLHSSPQDGMPPEVLRTSHRIRRRKSSRQHRRECRRGKP